MVREAPSWGHKSSLQVSIRACFLDIFIDTISSLGMVFVGTLKDI